MRPFDIVSSSSWPFGPMGVVRPICGVCGLPTDIIEEESLCAPSELRGLPTLRCLKRGFSAGHSMHNWSYAGRWTFCVLFTSAAVWYELGNAEKGTFSAAFQASGVARSLCVVLSHVKLGKSSSSLTALKSRCSWGQFATEVSTYPLPAAFAGVRGFWSAHRCHILDQVGGFLPHFRFESIVLRTAGIFVTHETGHQDRCVGLGPVGGLFAIL